MTTPPAPPATRPTALTLAVVSNKDSYPLNPAQSGKEFRDTLTQTRGRAPAPSAVDLTLKFTNPTAAPITFPLGGDESQFHFKLEGPGAVNIPNNIPMTREFRMGKPVTVKPGESYEHKITALAGGMRDMTEYSYFTEPGDYTLTVTFTTTIADQRTTLAADPVKFKVAKD
jgi:hypothetical protein